MESLNRCCSLVSGIRQVDRHGKDVLYSEAWIDRVHAHETLEHQACTCEQHERECDLRDHEGATDPLAPCGQCGPALAKRIAHFQTSSLKGRHQAEEDSQQN